MQADARAARLIEDDHVQLPGIEGVHHADTVGRAGRAFGIGRHVRRIVYAFGTSGDLVRPDASGLKFGQHPVDDGYRQAAEVGFVDDGQSLIVGPHAVRPQFFVREAAFFRGFFFPGFSDGDHPRFFQIADEHVVEGEVDGGACGNAVLFRKFPDHAAHGVGQGNNDLFPSGNVPGRGLDNGVHLLRQKALGNDVVHDRRKVGAGSAPLARALVVPDGAAPPGGLLVRPFNGGFLHGVKGHDGAHDFGCLFRARLVDGDCRGLHLGPFKGAFPAQILARFRQFRGHGLLHGNAAPFNGLGQLAHIVGGILHIRLEIQTHDVRPLGIGGGGVERPLMRGLQHLAHELGAVVVGVGFFADSGLSARVVGFVQDENGVGRDVHHELTPERVLPLDGVELIVGREHGVIRAHAVFHHIGQNLLVRLCRFGSERPAVGKKNGLVAGKFRVGRQGIEALHADVRKVAHHVGIEIGLHGDKDGDVALTLCPADDAGIDAPLADACLVADDKARSVGNIADGHAQGVHLLGGKILAEVLFRVAELPGHIAVDGAVALFKGRHGLAGRRWPCSGEQASPCPAWRLQAHTPPERRLISACPPPGACRRFAAGALLPARNVHPRRHGADPVFQCHLVRPVFRRLRVGCLRPRQPVFPLRYARFLHQQIRHFRILEQGAHFSVVGFRQPLQVGRSEPQNRGVLQIAHHLPQRFLRIVRFLYQPLNLQRQQVDQIVLAADLRRLPFVRYLYRHCQTFARRYPPLAHAEPPQGR